MLLDVSSQMQYSYVYILIILLRNWNNFCRCVSWSHLAHMLGIIIAKIFFRYVPSEKVRSVQSLCSIWFQHVAEYSGTV